MPKKAAELGPLAISRITAPGLHPVGGVAGLALSVSGTGARSWILRIVVGNRRRDIGLGGYPDVTLARARDAARDARDKVKAGIDPVEQRRAAKSRLIAESAAGITFKEAADRYIADHEGGWKNDKHAQQWRNTLDAHVHPVIGQIRVSDVALPHVMQVLEPIWAKIPETAARVRSRIELILDAARVRGYRKGENPARWRGHLDKLLPPRKKAATTRHHPALPYRQMGLFMTVLRAASGMTPRCMEFVILTACRSGEARGARWGEIDLIARTWKIPAGRMKAGKEHAIPLSDKAIELLQGLPRMADSDLVFPNGKGAPLSDMALTESIRRLDALATAAGQTGWKDGNGAIITAHGFRSSFRDWAGETTAFPREVIEHALAHQLADKAEAAYQRGTLFEKRRLLMAAWADHCGTPAAASGDVVPIRAAAA